MTKKLSEWRLTTMRGCGPACVRRDLSTYTRRHLQYGDQWGHEHHPGELVPCGTKVELEAAK